MDFHGYRLRMTKKWNAGNSAENSKILLNSTNTMEIEELRSLPRHELQKKAKEYGVKANQSTQAIIEQISEKLVRRSLCNLLMCRMGEKRR